MTTKSHLILFFVLAVSLRTWGETPVHAVAPKKVDVPVEEAESMVLQLAGQADSAIAAGRYDDAVVLLKSAASVAPDTATNVMLLNNLAMVYTYMGRDSLALATVDSALARAPRMTVLHEGRGRIMLNMGRDRDAYDAFAHAIALDSLSMQGRYYHGIMALYAGDAAMAKRDFDVLESVAPESLDTWLAMSAYYSLTRDDVKAIPYYKRILERDPSPEVYAALAGCYLGTGNLTEASATLADAMRLYPDDAELYYYRAWLNRDRLLLDDARADAARAISLGADAKRVQQLFK